jgi:hypothetical protein
MPLRISAKEFLESIKKEKVSKYKNKKIEYQGWKFDSKLECDFYKHLQGLKEEGIISLILRQVPIHLAPGSRLVVDFMVQYLGDYELYFYDTKGYMTDTAKTKIKLAEHLFGIKITIIKRGNF